jgi:hypothetical protein
MKIFSYLFISSSTKVLVMRRYRGHPGLQRTNQRFNQFNRIQIACTNQKLSIPVYRRRLVKEDIPQLERINTSVESELEIFEVLPSYINNVLIDAAIVILNI